MPTPVSHLYWLRFSVVMIISALWGWAPQQGYAVPGALQMVPFVPDTVALAIPGSLLNRPAALQSEPEQPPAEQSPDSSNDEQSQLDEIIDETQSELLNIFSFGRIFSAIIVIILVLLVMRVVVSLLETLAERFSNHRLIFKRFIPVFRISLWSAAIFFIISGIFDPPIETIITVSATIGIAVGFASQDILKNIFGGLMIILDSPFQVGDKIDIGGHYGEVVEIGLRSVRIVTPDDSTISVPNGELMNKAVSNTNSSALDCQVVSDIYLSTDVDIQEMRRLGRRAAITSRYVYLNKPIVINILNETRANRSYVVLRVKAYVLDIRYEFRFKSDVTELIMQELSDRGISAKVE